MLSLPPQALLLLRFSPAFTAATFQRWLLLCIGCIVTRGRRTVSRILWSIRPLLDGHFSSYHRVLSRRRWGMWTLGKILAAMVLELVPPDQPLRIVLDDTVAGPHTGKKVFGIACHRDPVRSSWRHTVFKWGHKWVVLAVLVKFPFAARPWALPILCALYRVKALDEQQERRHKTPSDLGRGLLAVLVHWFGDKRFTVLGDWGFGSHDLAWFCHRHRRHLTLIARSRADTCLYALPPVVRPKGKRGGTARKGQRLPTPREMVDSATSMRRQKLAWYGQSRRELQLLSACGGWYRCMGGGRAGLAPLRWVYTRLDDGHEDWLLCTDPALSAQRIVETFAGRWNVEVTFQEARACLGLESPRQRKENSILRTGPSLLCLTSVVSLIYAQILRDRKPHPTGTPCYFKDQISFSDALIAVRQLLWREVILPQVDPQGLVAQLPRPVRRTLLDHLAAAA